MPGKSLVLQAKKGDEPFIDVDPESDTVNETNYLTIKLGQGQRYDQVRLVNLKLKKVVYLRDVQYVYRFSRGPNKLVRVTPTVIAAHVADDPE